MTFVTPCWVFFALWTFQAKQGIVPAVVASTEQLLYILTHVSDFTAVLSQCRGVPSRRKGQRLRWWWLWSSVKKVIHICYSLCNLVMETFFRAVLETVNAFVQTSMGKVCSFTLYLKPAYSVQQSSVWHIRNFKMNWITFCVFLLFLSEQESWCSPERRGSVCQRHRSRGGCQSWWGILWHAYQFFFVSHVEEFDQQSHCGLAATTPETVHVSNFCGVFRTKEQKISNAAPHITGAVMIQNVAAKISFSCFEHHYIRIVCSKMPFANAF